MTVTQRYRDAESVPLETVYVFPLEEGSGGLRLRGEDRRRHARPRRGARRGFETYDDAMMDGHGAFLLDQERPNVITASSA